MRFCPFYSSLRAQVQQIMRWSVEELTDEMGAVLHVCFKGKEEYLSHKSFTLFGISSTTVK